MTDDPATNIKILIGLAKLVQDEYNYELCRINRDYIQKSNYIASQLEIEARRLDDE